MTDSTIDWRPDGSIKFDIDDVTVRWRPPKVKHVSKAKNANREVALQIQDRLEHSEDPDFDHLAFAEATVSLSGEWVRAVHEDLRLEGDLPADFDEWPHWLPTLRFSTAVLEHWGTHPFGLRTTENEQTESVS